MIKFLSDIDPKVVNFQAAIFDLDGTLLDTLEDIADSMNDVLQLSGFPTHPLNSYKLFIGDGTWNLVKHSLPPENSDDEAIIDHLDAFLQQYGTNWNHKTKPYPGIPALLDALVERGIPIAVLSNKPDEFTQTCVSTLLADWDFQSIIGLRPDLPAKPDPFGALKISNQLGLSPSQCCFFGDTNVDMQTAQSAGMYGVGVLWGFREQSELEENGANAIISKPSQAIQLFTGAKAF